MFVSRFVRSHDEMTTCAIFPSSDDVLFMFFWGNLIYEGMSKEDARIEVLRHIPQVSKIDGDMANPEVAAA